MSRPSICSPAYTSIAPAGRRDRLRRAPPYWYRRPEAAPGRFRVPGPGPVPVPAETYRVTGVFSPVAASDGPPASRYRMAR